MIVQPNVCQHSVDGTRSEVMWVVQEAKKQLREYGRLRKAAKAQEVMVNMAVCSVDCWPSAQRLLWAMTCGLD